MVDFARAAENYDAQIVKKRIVLFGYEHKLITNLTRYAPYHQYHASAVEAIATTIQTNMRTNFTHVEIVQQLNSFIQRANEGTFGANDTAPARNRLPLQFKKIVSFAYKITK